MAAHVRFDDEGDAQPAEPRVSPTAPININPESYRPKKRRRRHDGDGDAAKRHVRHAYRPRSWRDPLFKYWAQRHRLFSRFNEGIKIDHEGWYSTTHEAIALHIAERCCCGGGADTAGGGRRRRPVVVLDAMCGCGGNAIAFARQPGCAHVVAVDLDPGRVEFARHNAAIYGVAGKISFVVGDVLHLLAGWERQRVGSAGSGSTLPLPDVVFCSPPWGGPDYLKADRFDLEAGIGPDGARALLARLRRGAADGASVALLLPRNARAEDVAALAGPGGGACEVERNKLNGKVNCLTAYFGNLVVRPPPPKKDAAADD